MESNQRYISTMTIVLQIWTILLVPAAIIGRAGWSTAAEDGVEIMTRGPVHEAFADVGTDEIQPEPVINHPVPEPINEVPPDYRPEGSNVQWIPGYWSWDDDQNDFIWISGIWRDIPPGRQWVSGYWLAVDGGNQYVPGYWADATPAATTYLPPPPPPPRTAPPPSAASPGSVWVDGYWTWRNSGYAWRGGYWLRLRPDMVWIPAHYVWTPYGYIFVRGFWDYQLPRRGMMFAPRYYPRPVYLLPGYSYIPSIVLPFDSIILSLFIRKNHHHYYFGDYHDPRYEKRGFLPWYSMHATRHGYDPSYRSYRWYRLREDRHWERHYQQQFQYRHDHRDARPPIWYRQPGNAGGDRLHSRKNQAIGRPLADVVKQGDRHQFIRVRPDMQRDYRENAGKTAPSVRKHDSAQEQRPVFVPRQEKQPNRRQSDGGYEQSTRNRPVRTQRPGVPVRITDDKAKNERKSWTRSSGPTDKGSDRQDKRRWVNKPQQQSMEKTSRHQEFNRERSKRDQAGQSRWQKNSHEQSQQPERQSGTSVRGEKTRPVWNTDQRKRRPGPVLESGRERTTGKNIIRPTPEEEQEEQQNAVPNGRKW